MSSFVYIIRISIFIVGCNVVESVCGFFSFVRLIILVEVLRICTISIIW